ncbi:hypothetical protein AVEN_150550-1 [Araneus ventricosus]|uniref:Uncharacterized protein n=1 Tax=Araneus ventricosus TaxID=182803 RepID=A0A4Y2V833_ARAVE|nr:hypothetical protein AVEN_150550-1 [Araneus ventricosus]
MREKCSVLRLFQLFRRVLVFLDRRLYQRQILLETLDLSESLLTTIQRTISFKDKAAKLATAPTNSSTPLTDFKKYTKLLFYTKWQRQWDTETENKLHAVKPHVQPWSSLMNRKTDTLLTRLRVRACREGEGRHALGFRTFVKWRESIIFTPRESDPLNFPSSFGRVPVNSSLLEGQDDRCRWQRDKRTTGEERGVRNTTKPHTTGFGWQVQIQLKNLIRDGVVSWRLPQEKEVTKSQQCYPCPSSIFGIEVELLYKMRYIYGSEFVKEKLRYQSRMRSKKLFTTNANVAE